MIFNGCCFCFDLRSGVKIISILWILVAILTIIFPYGFDVKHDEKDNSGLSPNVTGSFFWEIYDDDAMIIHDDDADDDEKNSFLGVF